MNMPVVKTDNEPRPLLAWVELPDKWQREFDYIEPDDRWSARFAKYKGWVYDVFDTTAIPKAPWSATNPFAGWDSYHGDSFFSGVLFRLLEDDTIICGTYFS